MFHTDFLFCDILWSLLWLFQPKEQRSASAESSHYSVQEAAESSAVEMLRHLESRASPPPSSSSSSPPPSSLQPLPKSRQLPKSRETTRVIDKSADKRLSKSREGTKVLSRQSMSGSGDLSARETNMNFNHSSHFENDKVWTTVLQYLKSCEIRIPLGKQG
jgi:hypothetical protein